MENPPDAQEKPQVVNKTKKKDKKPNLRDIGLYLFAVIAGGAIGWMLILITDPTMGCFYQSLNVAFQAGIVITMIGVSIVGIFFALIKKDIIGRVNKYLIYATAGFLGVLFSYFLSLSAVNGESFRIPKCTPVTISVANCPGAADFTFEDWTSGNWVIRFEGDKKMGEALKYSNALKCGGDPVHALAFDFQLGGDHGAQIGLDGKGIPIVDSMSAWLYAPEGTPPDLAVRCFVMEGGSQGYAWYETPPKPLSPGVWVKISCPYSDFHWVQDGDGKGWKNPPQFIGLGFMDTQDKSYLGKVYITSIVIK